MKDYFARLRDGTLDVLKWLGNAAHRRAVAAIIAAIIAHYIGREIDSTIVDNVIYVALAAVLAAWSKRTPDIEAS